MAVVERSAGRLVAGDVLVSNFNDANNLQGTGRAIVEISPAGNRTTFARVPRLPGGTGLTTALTDLPRGFIAVGSLPTTDGTAATATQTPYSFSTARVTWFRPSPAVTSTGHGT